MSDAKGKLTGIPRGRADMYVSPFRGSTRDRIDRQKLSELVADLIDISEKYGNQHFRGRSVVIRFMESVIAQLLEEK